MAIRTHTFLFLHQWRATQSIFFNQWRASQLMLQRGDILSLMIPAW